MSQGAPVAAKRSGAGLVELERELDALLLQYESASLAWPKEPHILTRAKIGRRVHLETSRRRDVLPWSFHKEVAPAVDGEVVRVLFPI